MRNPKARLARSARMRVAFARSRDANEPGILYAVRAAGWHVVKLDGVGLPDLLCLHRDGLRACLLEVKVLGGRRLPSGRLTQPGRLTPAQLAMREKLARAGWYVHVVHTPEEALAALESRATPDNCHRDLGGTRRVRITRPAALKPGGTP